MWDHNAQCGQRTCMIYVHPWQSVIGVLLCACNTVVIDVLVMSRRQKKDILSDISRNELLMRCEMEMVGGMELFGNHSRDAHFGVFLLHNATPFGYRSIIEA